MCQPIKSSSVIVAHYRYSLRQFDIPTGPFSLIPAGQSQSISQNRRMGIRSNSPVTKCPVGFSPSGINSNSYSLPSPRTLRSDDRSFCCRPENRRGDKCFGRPIAYLTCYNQYVPSFSILMFSGSMQQLPKLLLVFIFLSGCQSSPPAQPPPMTKIDLMTICLAYEQYSQSYQKPPSKLEELGLYLVATEYPESHRQMEIDCMKKIQDGHYVVIWDQLGVSQVKPGEAKHLLLAYESTAKKTGGWGVFGGNRIEWLKPEDITRLTKSHN